MTGSEKIVRLVHQADAEDINEPKSSLVEQAIEEHGMALQGFLLRATGSVSETDDIIQEVYLRLVKKNLTLNMLTTPKKAIPKAYLLKTAVNIIRDRKRREKVRNRDFHSSLDETTCSDKSPLIENTLLWRQGIQIVDDALRELKPIHQQVFLLHRIENLTFPQISERTGIPLRTVQRYMSLALQHCKSALEKQKWFD